MKPARGNAQTDRPAGRKAPAGSLRLSLPQQHDDGVAGDGAVLSQGVHLFVRLGLDVDHAAEGGEESGGRRMMHGVGGDGRQSKDLRATPAATSCTTLRTQSSAPQICAAKAALLKPGPSPGVSPQHLAQVVPDRLLVGGHLGPLQAGQGRAGKPAAICT